MTGPEHYREAEQLLASTRRISDLSQTPYHMEDDAATIAAAQAHATLALASASALGTVAHFMGDDPAVTDWGRVIGHLKVASAVSP